VLHVPAAEIPRLLFDDKMTTMADVPLYVVSEYSSSERRITPAWSIAQLKTKMEPITGIPPSCQKISLKTPSHPNVPIEAVDEERTQLASFPLVPYAELQVRYSYAEHIDGYFDWSFGYRRLPCVRYSNLKLVLYHQPVRLQTHTTPILPGGLRLLSNLQNTLFWTPPLLGR